MKAKEKAKQDRRADNLKKREAMRKEITKKINEEYPDIGGFERATLVGKELQRKWGEDLGIKKG